MTVSLKNKITCKSDITNLLEAKIGAHVYKG